MTEKQVSRLRKAFTNNSLANIKLSKTQLSKMKQSAGFIYEPWKIISDRTYLNHQNKIT